MVQQNKQYSLYKHLSVWPWSALHPYSDTSVVETLSWTWPKVLSHAGSSDFQNIRSEFEWSTQIAKVLSFLLRQRRPLSQCWVVNIFWVVSQRQSACLLQFHYCSSTWSDNPVPFKWRRALNYITFWYIFPDQVSEKNDDVEDLKAKSFPFRKFLASVYWIDLWVKHGPL